MRERSRGLVPAFRALLVLLVVALTVLPATSAFAISRGSVLSRAQAWVDAPVRYSQSRYSRGYRTDCSGYVSMCWATGTSWSTRSFYTVTHNIPARQLQPGDAMLKKGYHIRLFYGWLDAQHTSYVAYEAGDVVAVTRIHSLADDLAFGYVPTRYDRISGSVSSSNLLRNGTFNVWARNWGVRGEQPVWWQVTGPAWQTLVAHRKDVYRGARNSLQLLNPSTDPNSYTEVSQSVSIVASAAYQLRAWARSAAASQAIEMQVTCLDAAGNPLSETRTSGQAWNIGASAFRLMSTTFMSPPGAVQALVTLRLAGGTTPGTTAAQPGTSVLFDDISLVRPQAAISIRRDARYRGSEGVVLTGSVTPTTAIGQTVTICVKRPGQGWEERACRVVIAEPGAAKWRCTFRFKSGAAQGVYYFKAKAPTCPSYLGAESSVLSLRLN